MIQSHVILDAKGLACPMPIVKTRKAVKATDKGSTAPYVDLLDGVEEIIDRLPANQDVVVVCAK